MSPLDKESIQFKINRIRRGSFSSVHQLIEAIEQYIEENNKKPKPFIWTASADTILRKVQHCKEVLETLH
ncbi:MAG: hypothetical protein HY466_03665 [Deltaproteobacteria bacterium]|nr:hypothetical protein [Deltaproteobacteria bacterium]